MAAAEAKERAPSARTHSGAVRDAPSGARVPFSLASAGAKAETAGSLLPPFPPPGGTPPPWLSGCTPPLPAPPSLPPPSPARGLPWPSVAAKKKKREREEKKQRRERRRRRARALPLLSPSLPLPPISTAANSWTGTTPAPASGTRSAPGRDGVTRGQRKLAWSTAAPGLPTQKPTSCIARPMRPPTHYKAMPPTTTLQASLDFLTLASTTRAQQGPTPPS